MSKRDLKEIRTVAKRAGWSVNVTGGGHLRFCPPPSLRGPCIFTGSTPSDHRAIANLRARLRKAGLGV